MDKSDDISKSVQNSFTPQPRAASVPRTEITPEHVYHQWSKDQRTNVPQFPLSRRQFLITAGSLGLSALLAAACARLPDNSPNAEYTQSLTPALQEIVTATVTPQATGQTDELGYPLNTYEEARYYNNFYEFSTNKTAVAGLVQDFKTRPWQIEIGGLVSKPQTLSIEDLLNYPQEERIYRLRCVETWSMVLPWLGFPLSEILSKVVPKPEARYVQFTALYDPAQMPGQKSSLYPWPYTEGLRLDEAMHDLTILATGLYGKPLPAQNGAPIRLIVPWKYGYKNIKSIVKIELTLEQPATLWSTIAPNEYGFYANVNPDVPHPRWSQASEQRIGETKSRTTLLFNGYAGEVASLYEGMDLKVNY